MAKGKGSRAGETKRQLASTSEILKPDYNMPDNYDDLLRIYKTLAKSADQRLVRLEQAAKTENYKTAIKWAYARAQRDIKAWSGPDATRFNTKPPKGITSLRSKIEDIKTFLKAPTSTKTGITEVYKKKAETFNRNHPGANYTWKELGKFFESKTADKLKNEFDDSETMAKVVTTIRKNAKELEEAIERQDRIDIKEPDDKMIEELVWQTVEEYGQDVIDAIFGKAE